MYNQQPVNRSPNVLLSGIETKRTKCEKDMALIFTDKGIFYNLMCSSQILELPLFFLVTKEVVHLMKF